MDGLDVSRVGDGLLGPVVPALSCSVLSSRPGKGGISSGADSCEVCGLGVRQQSPVASLQSCRRWVFVHESAVAIQLPNLTVLYSLFSLRTYLERTVSPIATDCATEDQPRLVQHQGELLSTRHMSAIRTPRPRCLLLADTAVRLEPRSRDVA